MSNAYLYFSNFDISTFMEDISHEIGHMQERYDKLLDKSLNKNGESTHNIINYTIQKMRNKNTYFDVFSIYYLPDN
jgi:predicted MarR family transcription regulator